MNYGARARRRARSSKAGCKTTPRAGVELSDTGPGPNTITCVGVNTGVVKIMAKAKKKAPTRRNAATAGADAIALLKADHRQVEEWFEQFESTRSDERKKKLAGQICQALEVHTQIEEEIFYPAFLQATEEEDIHHEAEIEHQSAKKLIAEIEGSGPDDDYYDAKVKVLSEMIKHHVKEEEQRDGMFAKARQSDMDLKELGSQLAARKQELMAGAKPAKSAARGSREPGALGRLVGRMR
jgi:hemerythrin superfamily protein